jgi:O-antigen ligase
MERTKAKYDLPKRVLLLLLVLWVAITFFLGIKIGFGGAIISIVIIPLALIFNKFPLAIIAAGVFGGTNFFRIFTYLSHIETAYVLYSLLIVAIIGGCAILFIKNRRAYYNVGLPEVLLSLIFLIVFLGLFHSKNLDYGILKTGLFFIGVLVPFIMIQVFRYNAHLVKRLFKFGLLFMVPATLASVVSLILGGASQWARFTFAGAGPVGFATGMGLAVLLALLQVENSDSTLERISVFVFAIFSLLVLVTAATRGPVLFLLFAYSIHMLFFSKFSKSKRIVVFLSVFATLAFFATKVSSFLVYRLVALQGVEMSAVGRAMLWKTSILHLFDAPIFGLGTGSFNSILFSGGKASGLIYPHNIFLEYYLELGIVGLSIFIAFLITITIRACKALKDPFLSKLQKTMLQNSIILAIYALSGAMVSGDFTNRYAYIFPGLVLALSYVNHAQKEKDAYRDGGVGSSA